MHREGRTAAARRYALRKSKTPGKSEEREKPPGDDGGFLWRMETGGAWKSATAAFRAKRGGFADARHSHGLGWLIKPFVTSIPKETLTFTLEATRKAVETQTSGALIRGRDYTAAPFHLPVNIANHRGGCGHWAARAMVSIDGLARMRRPRR